MFGIMRSRTPEPHKPVPKPMLSPEDLFRSRVAISIQNVIYHTGIDLITWSELTDGKGLRETFCAYIGSSKIDFVRTATLWRSRGLTFSDDVFLDGSLLPVDKAQEDLLCRAIKHRVARQRASQMEAPINQLNHNLLSLTVGSTVPDSITKLNEELHVHAGNPEREAD
jgi:hypothetical protein